MTEDTFGIRPNYATMTNLLYGDPVLLFPPTYVDPDPVRFRQQLVDDYRCLSGIFTNDCCTQACGRNRNNIQYQKEKFLVGIESNNIASPDGPYDYFGEPFIRPYRTYTATPLDENKCTKCVPQRIA